jgi:adenosine deaminase
VREKITSEFIKKIPKTDLHLHLDGSLRLGTLIELAKKDGVKLPSYDEAGLKELVFKPAYKDLGEYLKGFGYTCAVMRTAENIERISKELVEDNIAEGVRYIEVRFAPQLNTTVDLSMTDVVRAVSKGLASGAKAHNASAAVKEGKDIPFHFGIIICAMRRFSKGMSPYFADFLRVLEHAPKKEIYAAASLELARTGVILVEEEGLPIVGFDLAGEEAGFPSLDHWEAYQYAHKHFIRKTVHAGEAYGPESIFQAITECHANRIGHGTFLFAADRIKDPAIKDHQRYVDNLINYIASQRIGVEVCVTSNLQTIPEIKSVDEHPVHKMIETGLSVTICTDNRLVSNTSVSRELELVATSAKLTRKQVRNLIVAGFKGSFFPGSYNQKRAFVREVIAHYEHLEKTMLPPL